MEGEPPVDLVGETAVAAPPVERSGLALDGASLIMNQNLGKVNSCVMSQAKEE